jgi:hypothetical protein
MASNVNPNPIQTYLPPAAAKEVRTQTARLYASSLHSVKHALLGGFADLEKEFGVKSYINEIESVRRSLSFSELKSQKAFLNNEAKRIQKLDPRLSKELESVVQDCNFHFDNLKSGTASPFSDPASCEALCNEIEFVIRFSSGELVARESEMDATTKKQWEAHQTSLFSCLTIQEVEDKREEFYRMATARCSVQANRAVKSAATTAAAAMAPPSPQMAAAAAALALMPPPPPRPPSETPSKPEAKKAKRKMSPSASTAASAAAAAPEQPEKLPESRFAGLRALGITGAINWVHKATHDLDLRDRLAKLARTIPSVSTDAAKEEFFKKLEEIWCLIEEINWVKQTFTKSSEGLMKKHRKVSSKATS